MIDPLTGEGIGNGIYSGFIAAELAEQCLAEQRFDAEFLKAYDTRIARVLRSELRLSYRFQQIIGIKWLANGIVSLVVANPKVMELLSRMYTDLELRGNLVKPSFWWKLFRGKMGKATPAGSTAVK